MSDLWNELPHKIADIGLAKYFFFLNRQNVANKRAGLCR